MGLQLKTRLTSTICSNKPLGLPYKSWLTPGQLQKNLLIYYLAPDMTLWHIQKVMEVEIHAPGSLFLADRLWLFTLQMHAPINVIPHYPLMGVDWRQCPNSLEFDYEAVPINGGGSRAREEVRDRNLTSGPARAIGNRDGRVDKTIDTIFGI